MMPFHEVYWNLLKELVTRGVHQKNARTGVHINVMEGGAGFVLNLNDNILPTCGLRKTWPHVAAAELAWCLMGHSHINWLQKHTHTWDAFAENDDGAMDAAYGYRWRSKFGRDQLDLAIKALRADPSDRRIWISSWDPSVDGLGATGQKTVPCPVGFTLSILQGQLQSALMIRSSDVLMGLPYDVMRHALLMRAVASELSIDLGFMQVTLAHPHLYENHKIAADCCLAVVPVVPMIDMLDNDFWQITSEPDDYVACYRFAEGAMPFPSYSPKIEVNI